MAGKLLIVESPAKAKTIKKYLGAGFDVRASVGHIRDLPISEIGVDVDNGFSPKYVVSKGKEKVIADLKKAANKADEIYLGPDPDREGEAIAWHIREALSDKRNKDKPYYRVLFHEITKDAVKKALENPELINQERFESQQARRIMDRLVGYNISPLLWRKVKRGLSAGRVQSVALRLLTERERARAAFKPEEYWSLTAKLAAGEPPEFEAKLSKVKTKKADLKTGDQTNAVVEAVKQAEFTVSKMTKRTVQQRPQPPYRTSTLQQEAFTRLGFAAARTMRLAQQLYEGVDLGKDGSVGLITYMRTDSVRIAPEAAMAAKDCIGQMFGPDYIPAKPPFYKSPKGAQEAHEAIRPTSALRSPDKMRKFLSNDQAKLYDLIWRRFLASQMAPAKLAQTAADITAADCTFRASGSIVVFEGFRKALPETPKKGEATGKSSLLPPLKEGQVLELKKLDPKQHFTQPPPRYTDASLVKEMEDKGIGRPSTYASILSTLVDKEYAGREKGRFSATELGMLVTDLLVESFPQLMDVGFTAQMEADLDQIEEGKTDWRGSLEQFYGPFSQTLEVAKKTMADMKGKGVPTDLNCPNCGSQMVIKFGRAGQFLACSAYPDCKTTSDFTKDDDGKIIPVAQKETDEECPVCGKKMIERSGRYGRFLACSGYPDCKTTKPLNGEDNQVAEPEPTDYVCDKCGQPMVIKTSRRGGGRFLACTGFPKCKNAKGLPTGVSCPRDDCDGELVERTSKRGKVFYGCSKYPKCNEVMWNKPVPRACPECGSPYLVEKKLKKGLTLVCPEKNCKFQEPVAPAEDKKAQG